MTERHLAQSLVSQVVLHPYVSQTLRVCATTVGRDKAYRAVQYLARFLAWYYAKEGYSKDSIARLTALKSTLGTSRKLMRIGKPMEHLQAFLKSLDLADPILKFTAAGRQMAYALYLTFDTLTWLNITRVYPFPPATAAAHSIRASRFWLTGIAFSIFSGLYKSVSINRKLAANIRAHGTQDADKGSEEKALRKQLDSTRSQLLLDILDISIPASSLGYLKIEDGYIGLAGFITSLMGLKTQIDNVLSK